MARPKETSGNEFTLKVCRAVVQLFLIFYIDLQNFLRKNLIILLKQQGIHAHYKIK